jgi:hypothetical protein
MLPAMLHCDNARTARRRCNSPAAVLRHPSGFALALVGLLGFNLNKICYLFVAAFDFRSRGRRATVPVRTTS